MLVANKQLRLIPRRVSFWWLLFTEPMFEFSRSARRQVEFDTQTGGWLSMQSLLSSHRPQATRKPCLNSHTCVHGRKLVSVEGGDCSKRSNLVCWFCSFLLGVCKKQSVFCKPIPRVEMFPFDGASHFGVYPMFDPQPCWVIRRSELALAKRRARGARKALRRISERQLTCHWRFVSVGMSGTGAGGV